MSFDARRDVTTFIWSICIGIGVFLLFLSGEVDILFLGFISALIATAIIWGSGVAEAIFSQGKQPYIPPPQQKSEDSTAYKLAMLMELMDEHEREVFKNRLADSLIHGDDSVTIESLIAEKRKRG
jgi:hypothetical protein